MGLSGTEIDALPIRSGIPPYLPLISQSIRNFDWLVTLDSTTYTPLPDVDANAAQQQTTRRQPSTFVRAHHRHYNFCAGHSRG